MNIGATFENSSNPSEDMSVEAAEKWQEKVKKFKAMKEKYGIKDEENQEEHKTEDNENLQKENASEPLSDKKR